MNPIYKFFKRLSVTKKVMTISIALLMIGYIFCLPRQLFHVPYSTVVTDRNEELLGARIERQHLKKSSNVLLPLKINTFTTIGELIRYLPEEHSIRI